MIALQQTEPAGCSLERRANQDRTADGKTDTGGYSGY